jgi:hypothetical protein
MNMRVTFAFSVTPSIASVVLPLTLGLLVSSCRGTETGGVRSAAGQTIPAGYALRLDRENRSPADFAISPDDDGFRVQTGPAGILYRPDQVIESDHYTVRARFTEIDAPVGHLEGYGVFVGGRDLESDAQRYLYFLVRGDGHYLITQREGFSTRTVSDGWQRSEAVKAPTGDHDVTNELAIMVEPERVHFLCNGERVADLPLATLSLRGTVGVRVNHNLRVRVQGFHVES